jgi:hypothetical protein
MPRKSPKSSEPDGSFAVVRAHHAWPTMPNDEDLAAMPPLMSHAPLDEHPLGQPRIVGGEGRRPRPTERRAPRHALLVDDAFLGEAPDETVGQFLDEAVHVDEDRLAPDRRRRKAAKCNQPRRGQRVGQLAMR